MPTIGEKIVGYIIHRQMLLPTADNMSGRKLAADYIDEEFEAVRNAAIEVDRWFLVIESAIRRGDPGHRDEVVAALRGLRRFGASPLSENGSTGQDGTQHQNAARLSNEQSDSDFGG